MLPFIILFRVQLTQKKRLEEKTSIGPKAVVVVVERSAQVLSQYKACAALLKVSEGS